MNIQPNWTVSDQGPWQLVYNEYEIISLALAQGIISTQGKLFVGTLEECQDEISRLGLPWNQIPDDPEPPMPEPTFSFDMDIVEEAEPTQSEEP
jgi:hypothetical protein